MKLTFFGTRGSTPVSGREFIRYGGHTTCIALNACGRLLIVDCGTGLLALQNELAALDQAGGADIFISHIHWDHIQGVAFFSPFFSPRYRFDLYSEPRYGHGIQEQIAGIMNSPMFPIEADSFGADIRYHDLACGQDLDLGGVKVRTIRLDHPNVCTGFRFEAEGKSVCIAADYEHGGMSLSDFVRGADVLVYDAQYTDEEYPSKRGWGHSTWREGCLLARECGVKRLLLTHHDPSHTDETLDRLAKEASSFFPAAEFTRDGYSIEV